MFSLAGGGMTNRSTRGTAGVDRIRLQTARPLMTISATAVRTRGTGRCQTRSWAGAATDVGTSPLGSESLSVIQVNWRPMSPADHAVNQQSVRCRIDLRNSGVMPLVVEVGRRDSAQQVLMRGSRDDPSCRRPEPPLVWGPQSKLGRWSARSLRRVVRLRVCGLRGRPERRASDRGR